MDKRHLKQRAQDNLRADEFVLANDEAYDQEASESESGYLESGSGKEGSEYAQGTSDPDSVESIHEIGATHLVAVT